MIQPSDRVKDYVDSILIIENYDVQDRFSLPLFANGKPSLLFQNVQGCIRNSFNYLTLFGQTIRPIDITFFEKFTLIAFFFKPYAVYDLFGLSANELTDNPINLRLLYYKKAGELQEKLVNAASLMEMVQILDSFVFGLISGVKGNSRLVSLLTDSIIENSSKEIIVDIQKKFFLAERTMQRLFHEQVGLAPNQFRKVVQFDAALKQLIRGQFHQLSDIALDNHYADQSHFNRTFKKLTGLTPSEYLNLVR